MSTFVKYFIPEDGDDQAHPNVFRIAGNAQGLTVGQVRKVSEYMYSAQSVTTLFKFFFFNYRISRFLENTTFAFFGLLET
jgi:hypothetical protein